MLIEADMNNPIFRELIDGTVRAAIAEYKKQMAELQPKWTSDLPTQEGWYWNKQCNNEPTIEIVSKTGTGQLVIDDGECCVESVKRFGGEWYGPIEPPEYP